VYNLFVHYAFMQFIMLDCVAMLFGYGNTNKWKQTWTICIYGVNE